MPGASGLKSILVIRKVVQEDNDNAGNAECKKLAEEERNSTRRIKKQVRFRDDLDIICEKIINLEEWGEEIKEDKIECVSFRKSENEGITVDIVCYV